MSIDISFVSKLLAAGRALVWFAVNSHVSIEKSLIAKSLPAVLAFVRSGVVR